MISHSSSLLWQPDPDYIRQTHIFQFMKSVNADFNTYEELYKWSIECNAEFWEKFLEYAQIIFSEKHTKVKNEPNDIFRTQWFCDLKLNFAENLLRYRDDEIAIIAKTEDRPSRYITFSEVYEETSLIHQVLRDHDIKIGDRVVGYMANTPETIYGMLATTSLGAIWSSGSPDFGLQSIIDRFGQIEPKILFMNDSYVVKSENISILDRVESLLKNIPSLEKIIIVPYANEERQPLTLDKVSYLTELLVSYRERSNAEINFAQVNFNHPVYTMFSSGTTGKPKCIVQGSGVLLNHLKELMLHTNLSRTDKIFYVTTCSWMMWNWLVSSLSVGATLVLYDGNPLYPRKDALWQLIEKEEITIFGTSARYLSLMNSMKIKPKNTMNLTSLKTILSTGSPLAEKDFKYVYQDVKSNIQLSSISGGTDINGCFALGNPMLPVFAGELQCIGLGMKVNIFDSEGKPVMNRKGELVCENATPSMPLFFWNDNTHEKYKNTYFDKYQNIWCHGDYALMTNNGGVIIFGRSDATLNPGGIRLGTAEIYQQVEKFSEVADSLAVEDERSEKSRIILFVKMVDSHILTEEMKTKIIQEIKKHTSKWHIPSDIIEVPDIPYTFNMKKIEVAVKKIIHNEKITNVGSIMNPDSLIFFNKFRDS